MAKKKLKQTKKAKANRKKRSDAKLMRGLGLGVPAAMGGAKAERGEG